MIRGEKPERHAHDRGDLESDNDDKSDQPVKQKLEGIVKKLKLKDQLVLHKGYKDMPNACNTVWHIEQRHLDFRTIKEQLRGENVGSYLCNMLQHFKHVYFQADRLQDNLNMLERSGVKSMNSVMGCQLFMSSSDSDTGHQGNGDAASNSFSQWPLHALPKLLRNLRRLKVHCDVQVHFIDKFPQLEQLTLYGDVGQSALMGILERCSRLRRLYLKSNRVQLQLQNIDRCKTLQDLSLPVLIFGPARDQVLMLPRLQALELTHAEQRPQLTIECLRSVIERKADDMEIIQMDCKCFDGPLWLRDVQLNRCKRLRGLVLIGCSFKGREICELKLPQVSKYLVLGKCHDLKDHQLLDIVKKCPGLCELYLIDCTLLTGRVLRDIYRVRRSENLDYPLSVVLSECPAIDAEYQDKYSRYWEFKAPIMKLEEMGEEIRPVEDIVLFFYKK